MTGISRSPESSQSQMPGYWDVVMARNDPTRSAQLQLQAEGARLARHQRLLDAGLREGSRPQVSRR